MAVKIKRLAILGGGNLGQALAKGWAESGLLKARHVHITRRQVSKLESLSKAGFRCSSDNAQAALESDVVVLAVQPGQLEDVMSEISPVLEAGRHTVVSTITGVTIDRIADLAPEGVVVVRAMPNTAVETLSSMTCLSVDAERRGEKMAIMLFDKVGATLVINEEMMIPATALCACGIAFFLRTIRAAAQGGTEIGFHADEALLLAAQTARGAADLILQGGAHPEQEIDRVTTPRGCTIAGLNELEHRGFSSAMPFYKTGTVRKEPIGDADVEIVLNLLEDQMPDHIFVAGDLSDPHGTHRMCYFAIQRALRQFKEMHPERSHPLVWLYRGAWQEWEIDATDVFIPMSKADLDRKIEAIFKHESQKDRAMYPGAYDTREFWERAKQRNQETATRIDALGLPEFHAVESYVCVQDLPS